MRGWLVRNIRFNVKTAMVHAACWSLFIGYELASLHYALGRLESPMIYLIFYAVNIAYFYGHAALLNFIFNRPRPIYLKGVFLWILLFFSYLTLKMILDQVFTPSRAYLSSWGLIKNAFAAAYLFRGAYISILSTAYWASGYIAFYKKQALAAENAYLQQQLNPHLLFNTLNFIYSDVYEQAPDAGRSVLLLSDILRFGLEAAGPDGKTALKEELLHVEQLLEINRYRFHHALQLSYKVEGEPGELRIIPLVLMTLAENVFKHGNLKDTGAPGLIRVDIERTELRFYSQNKKKAKSAFRQSAQLGLKNLRLRLDYSYPGRYTLDIAETADLFELTLTLKL
jgi:two-component system, LytTR family, sensor kinase